MAKIEGVQCKIVDEYGYPFPVAQAVCFDWAIDSTTRGSGDAVGEEYDITHDVGAISYFVNYWYTDDLRKAGKKSRPLRIDDGNDGFTDVMMVDMNQADIKNVMSATNPIEDRVTHAIKLDIMRKFR